MSLLAASHVSPTRWTRSGAWTRRAATGSDLLAGRIEEPDYSQTGDALLSEDTPDLVGLLNAFRADLLESSMPDARALSRWDEALPFAARLGEGLADLIGLPEIDMDHDGDVALDWYLPQEARLAASVNPSGGVIFVFMLHDGSSTKKELPSVSQATAAVRRVVRLSANAIE